MGLLILYFTYVRHTATRFILVTPMQSPILESAKTLNFFNKEIFTRTKEIIVRVDAGFHGYIGITSVDPDGDITKAQAEEEQKAIVQKFQKGKSNVPIILTLIITPPIL